MAVYLQHWFWQNLTEVNCLAIFQDAQLHCGRWLFMVNV
jgi:hypothetical protein